MERFAHPERPRVHGEVQPLVRHIRIPVWQGEPVGRAGVVDDGRGPEQPFLLQRVLERVAAGPVHEDVETGSRLVVSRETPDNQREIVDDGDRNLGLGRTTAQEHVERRRRFARRLDHVIRQPKNRRLEPGLKNPLHGTMPR